MIIRRAQPTDIPTITRWRHQTARWLDSLGSDQWSDAGLSPEVFLDRVADSVGAGETWIAEDDGQPVGTAAIDQWADEDLWTPHELSEALVLHRMIVPREFSNRGIGRALIDHAEQLAIAAGLKWLRLDAWTNNKALHSYYQAQGFRHVRTVPDKPSGALFERPVPPQPAHTKTLLDTTTRLARTPEPDEGRGAENPSPPPYTEQINDLYLSHHPIRTSRVARAELGPNDFAEIRCIDGHWRWRPGRSWGWSYADTVIGWPASVAPNPASDYVIREHNHRVYLERQPA